MASTWLDEVLKSQQHREDYTQEDLFGETSMTGCLSFQSDGVNFVVPFSAVAEVVEVQELVPYSRPMGHHVGIMNVRGVVVPLISLVKETSNSCSCSLSESSMKAIVFDVDGLGRFSVYASQIKKVYMEEEKLMQDSVSVNDTPARVLRADVLSEMLYEEAA